MVDRAGQKQAGQSSERRDPGELLVFVISVYREELPMEADDVEDEFSNVERKDVVRGRVIGFLRRNLFTVQIDDGQAITVMMPKRFLPQAAKAPMGFSKVAMIVDVLLREPPKLPVVLRVGTSSWCGPVVEAPPSPFP